MNVHDSLKLHRHGLGSMWLLLAAAACGASGSNTAPPEGGPQTDGSPPNAPVDGADAATPLDGSQPDGPTAALDGTAPDGASQDAASHDAGLGCTGPFTLDHQEPVDCLPYPGSLWNKPLPADVMQHLASNSQAVVDTVFNDDPTNAPTTRQSEQSFVSTASSDGVDPNTPLYYGQATDPVYQFTSCPNESGSHSAVGAKFHAPDGATCNYDANNDAMISVWDQTSDTLYSAYGGAPQGWMKLPACPGGGHAGTDADPCPVTSFENCAASDWATDPGFGILGSADSLGSGGWATHDRGAEMASGSIHHAQYLNTDCTVGHVFPASFDTLACAPGNDTNRPAQGALFFLDYTATQLADIKAKVPLWQYELIEAMSVYGGYVGDTGLGGIRIGRSFEGPAAYDAANEPYPLGAWLMTFPHDDSDPNAPLYCAKKTAGYECVFNMYLGVPLETGPNCTSTPCSVGQHLHMADPCVAQGLAGVTGGCE